MSFDQVIRPYSCKNGHSKKSHKDSDHYTGASFAGAETPRYSEGSRKRHNNRIKMLRESNLNRSEKRRLSPSVKSSKSTKAKSSLRASNSHVLDKPSATQGSLKYRLLHEELHQEKQKNA